MSLGGARDYYLQHCNPSKSIMKKIRPDNFYQLLTSPLGKRIDQRVIEKWSATFWSTSEKKRTHGKPFTMMFPPPNITGNLHLGHALTAALQDALIRQRCMQGSQAIWIPGFDHAGLATQNVVERSLWRNRGITRQELGREKFIDLANEWKDTKRNEMREQLDRLGLALDGNKEYFTMDDNSSLAVHEAFKRLFKKGVIYRSVKPVFWSEELQTTLSDIEVANIDGQERFIRTGEVVTRRPVSQWFVNAREMAHRSVEVVEKELIGIIPPNYTASWSSWLVDNGVQDWCISRQSWWGHRIPAYKMEDASDTPENWVVADNADEARMLLGQSQTIMQDPDVLDTWFSSSLLPLTVSGWPNEEKFNASCKEGHFPLDVMETGFDILNYWVSKMVMMSLELENQIPFKLILLHGMICDSAGKKMSKSRGNVIDPLDVIDGASLDDLQRRTRDLNEQGIIEDSQLTPVLENQKKLFPKGISECGADGLRAYLLSHDVQEEVVRIRTEQIEKVRKLANKIWNIFRFTVTTLDSIKDLDLDLDVDLKKLVESKLTDTDKRVLKELSHCVYRAQTSFNAPYELHKCFNTLELFWTVHLSNKYIESIKSDISSQATPEEIRKLKLTVLIKCMVTSTKLLHPFMPHLTEFLYQKLALNFNNGYSNSKNLSDLSSLSFEPFPEWEEWKICS